MIYARRMWPAFETYHAHIYFVPEAAEAYRRLGLKGGWMGYFAATDSDGPGDQRRRRCPRPEPGRSAGAVER